MSETIANRQAAAAGRSDNRALDWLNFLLADVQGGVGPFLAIFLISSQHWNSGSAGLVLTVGGLATVAGSSPLGALVDHVRWKRAIVVAGALTVGIASLVMASVPQFVPVLIAQAANGLADAAFPAAVAGISLGLVRRAAYTARTGRNQAWNHGGNVVTAIGAGAAGYLIAPAAVLWIVAVLSLAAIAAVLTINPRHIDHDVARGADDGDQEPAPKARREGGLKAILKNRPLLLFTLSITCFHFANAAMLTLAGEKLAREYGGASSAVMAGCIIIAQFVMVPMAILVGRRADAWGRKPLFLACFTALPVRGALFALSQRTGRGALDPGARRRRRRHLRRAVPGRGRRHDQGYRALQPRPRCLRRLLGVGGRPQQRRCRGNRGARGLPGRFRFPRRVRADRPAALCDAGAGNQASRMSIFTDHRLAALLIFVATYAVIALGKVPYSRLDRAGAALLGAALMVAAGVLSLKQAEAAIDLDTITLLLGMMIVVANLRLSGFFRLVTGWAVVRARHPALLLVAVVLVSGLLSAFLVNDTICLVLTPLVLDIVLRLKRNPVPYLLGIAMASNVGSTATITGNPQNMIIGTLSGISYRSFAAALAPVAAIGLVLTVLVIGGLWWREFLTGGTLEAEAPPAHAHRGMMLKTLAVTAVLVVAFFAGLAPPKAAIVAGAVLLLTRAVKPEKVYAQIDWTLLLMFAGLFIVVAGLERTWLTPQTIAAAAQLHLNDTAALSGVVAVLSNLVSNVPAVLVLRSFVAHLHDPQRAWLVVAMASTLAGNFTILGSVANLIVVQRARQAGVTVRFGTYFAAGAPLTVLTILVGIALL